MSSDPMSRYEDAEKTKTPIICENCNLYIGVIPVCFPKWSLVVCEECMLNVIVPDIISKYHKDTPENKIYEWKARIRKDAKSRRNFFKK